MRKVRIIKPPKAQTGLETNRGSQSLNIGMDTSYDTFNRGIEVNKTLRPVSWNDANLEAEKGETVVTNMNNNGLPEHYTIGGKRHYEGGTPLNLPANSFIFSRDRKLAFNKDDADILNHFGLKVKKGRKAYTPADIAKKYQINDYLKILADPMSDRISIETAEMMISNYVDKLGALALAQEAKKGFPQGIPSIAIGYLEKAGIDPQSLLQLEETNSYGSDSFKEGGIPDRYKRKGFDRVGQKIESDRSDKKWMVLAKKGDQYKIVHGGQKGMQDYSQHHNDERRERFWNRMGGKNSSQANDPFSPLYWHKKFGTWKDGGQIPIAQFGREQDRFKRRKVRVTMPSFETSEYNKLFNPTAPQSIIYSPIPKTSKQSTKVQNIPKGKTKWDPTKEGYDESKVRVGDYIKRNNVWYKVTGFEVPPYEGEVDKRIKDPTLQEAYGRLEQLIANNEGVRSSIIKKFRENVKDLKPNSNTGLTKGDIQSISKLSDDEIIKYLLEGQKQVFAINSTGSLSEIDPDDQWDKRRDLYENYVKDLGFTPMSPAETAAFQTAYVGLVQTKDDPEYKDILGEYKLGQVGRPDEPGGGTGLKTVSDVDGWFGNTTAGQAAVYQPISKKLKEEEVEWESIPEQPSIRNLETTVEDDIYAPFWLQDKINTFGAAADLWNLKRYKPWQAVPAYATMDPTFYDPTRALAAVGEQARIAGDITAQFAGPQQMSSRLSSIQGQAARQTADIASQYDERNVGTANQFEQLNTQIMNQAARERAGLATQLWDKYSLMNQNFDNAKRALRTNLRNQYVNALTNRAITQTLNTLYPQFNVDPSTGGFTYFDKGRPLYPSNNSKETLMERVSNYKDLYPGWSDEAYIAAAKADAGIPDENPMGIDPSFFANYLNAISR